MFSLLVFCSLQAFISCSNIPQVDNTSQIIVNSDALLQMQRMLGTLLEKFAYLQMDSGKTNHEIQQLAEKIQTLQDQFQSNHEGINAELRDEVKVHKDCLPSIENILRTVAYRDKVSTSFNYYSYIWTI